MSDELKRDLQSAQYYLISLAAKSLPTDAKQSLIHGYRSCETSSSFWEWETDVLQKIVAAAEPDAERRAFCPLCKEGTRQWGWYDERGFIVPDGLRSHLKGEGRVRQCHIFAVAFAKARDHLEPKLREEEQRKEEMLKKRRRTERLFRVDTGPPELIDQSVGQECRNAAQLKWAEARLRLLHFKFDLNANVMSYSLSHDEFIIFADPRGTKSIEFRVFARLPSGKPRLLPKHRNRYERFLLPDAWENELPFKFKKMVEEACNLARGGPKRRAE